VPILVEPFERVPLGEKLRARDTGVLLAGHLRSERLFGGGDAFFCETAERAAAETGIIS